MAEATIPVDLFNPGQVFACIGLVEAADVLMGRARGRFSWEQDFVQFTLSAGGIGNPVKEVMNFLRTADVYSIAPTNSLNTTEKWDVKTLVLSNGSAFPSPDPDSPATLPAVLKLGDVSLALWHWADLTQRDNVKFWAGSGGYPGVALLRDAQSLLVGMTEGDLDDPFAFGAPQSSSFRFDWRRDYIPLDAGFSPNAHGYVVMTGFPIVEMLAAIGLSDARPTRPQRANKLLYEYGVIGSETLLPPCLLRAALSGGACPVPGQLWRRFRIHLGWPGQEGQARCITDVQEIPEETRT